MHLRDKTNSKIPNTELGDDLLDAIKNVPSRRKNFLMGTRKFLRGARLPIIGALLDSWYKLDALKTQAEPAFKAMIAGLLGAGTAADQ